MIRVNKSRPCPVCGKTDWCLVDEQGTAAICQRIASDRKCNDAGYLHKLGHTRNQRMTTKTKPKPKDETDWHKAATRLASVIKEQDRRIADAMLGVPVGTIEKYMPMVGFNNEDIHGQCWTFPMVNGAENVVGISRRYMDGSKKSIGSNGLFVPQGWRDHTGIVYIVEGASDVLAMSAAGLCAIGRPSNNSGIGMLIALLQDLDQSRTVVVVGERDANDYGLWPGLAACHVAKELKDSFRCSRPKMKVKWALPPEGFKDCRVYLTSFTESVSWHLRGKSLAECLTSDAMFAGEDTLSLVRMVVELRDELSRMQDQINQLREGEL